MQGRSVLVAGGAGSVGHYAVQFARLLGASRVLATASNAAKAELARAAGADAVIDYRGDDPAGQLRDAAEGRGIDRIVEVDIAANAALDAEVVRAGGEIVVYGSGRPQVELPFFPLLAKNVALRFFIVYNLSPADRERALHVLNDFLMRGALVHNVAERLPLERIVEAHEKVEQGAATGNVVLRIP